MATIGPHESKITDTAGNVYTLGKLLGRGIEGQTFKATVQKVAKGNKSLQVGDEVAVKRQSGSKDPEVIAAREREMLVLQREGTLLGSKKPKTKDPDQSLYMVQPIFPGVDLRQALYEIDERGIGEKKDISAEEKEKISIALLNDYFAMQELNIVHSDIKPDNILYDSASGTAKIIDMGQAFNAVEGSPHERFQAPGFLYFSPEALDAKDVKNSAQTDMYGLGIVIASIYSDNNYERDAEYGKEDNFAIEVRAALSDVIGPDVKHKEGMPDDLLKIVQHMTEVDPHARPANIALARGAAEYTGTQAIYQSQQHAEQFKTQLKEDINSKLLNDRHVSVDFKDRVREIINNNDDLLTIRVAFEKLSTEFPNEKAAIKKTNTISDSIDSFTVGEAREIQALRVAQLDQAKEKLYTDSVRGIASMLNGAANQHKSNNVTVPGGGMTFITMGPVNISNFNEVGKVLFVAAKTIATQKNPAEVDNVLSRLQDAVGKMGTEKFGNDGAQAKNNLLSKIDLAIKRHAQVKDYAPQLESNKPKASQSRLGH